MEQGFIYHEEKQDETGRIDMLQLNSRRENPQMLKDRNTCLHLAEHKQKGREGMNSTK